MLVLPFNPPSPIRVDFSLDFLIMCFLFYSFKGQFEGAEEMCQAAIKN